MRACAEAEKRRSLDNGPLNTLGDGDRGARGRRAEHRFDVRGKLPATTPPE
jgi:hypothetical protein